MSRFLERGECLLYGIRHGVEHGQVHALMKPEWLKPIGAVTQILPDGFWSLGVQVYAEKTLGSPESLISGQVPVRIHAVNVID